MTDPKDDDYTEVTGDTLATSKDVKNKDFAEDWLQEQIRKSRLKKKRKKNR